MTFRCGLSPITRQCQPGDGRSAAERYAGALYLAVFADELGLDSAWVSEHHFVDDAYLPFLFPMCAAIAARTRRIGVGIALLLTPFRDPLRVAEGATVVDLNAGGRLIFGLDWRAEELDALGLGVTSVTRTERWVEVLLRGWGPGLARVRHRRSLRLARAVPAGGAAGMDRSDERAGCAARRSGRRRVHGRRGHARVGRLGWNCPGRLAVEPALPGRRAPADLRLGRRRLLRCRGPFRLRHLDWKYEGMDAARARTASPAAPPAWVPGQRNAPLTASVVGTPEEVAHRIGAYRRAAVSDLHYIARLMLPGLPPDRRQRDALQRFAEDVAPRSAAGGAELSPDTHRALIPTEGDR